MRNITLAILFFIFTAPVFAVNSSNEPFVVTKTYNIYVSVNCQEGEISCDNVTYHAVNRKNHQEITLKGHVVNKKPSMDFARYEFDNGEYSYTLTPDYAANSSNEDAWVLSVYKKNALVFSEEGKTSSE